MAEGRKFTRCGLRDSKTVFSTSFNPPPHLPSPPRLLRLAVSLQLTDAGADERASGGSCEGLSVGLWKPNESQPLRTCCLAVRPTCHFVTAGVCLEFSGLNEREKEAAIASC